MLLNTFLLLLLAIFWDETLKIFFYDCWETLFEDEADLIDIGFLLLSVLSGEETSVIFLLVTLSGVASDSVRESFSFWSSYIFSGTSKEGTEPTIYFPVKFKPRPSRGL